MIYASQLLLLPLFVLVVWVYIRLSRDFGKRASVTVYDVAVVVLALVLSAAAVRGVYRGEELSPGVNYVIWRSVLSTLVLYFLFPACLLVGALLRRFVFLTRGH